MLVAIQQYVEGDRIYRFVVNDFETYAMFDISLILSPQFAPQTVSPNFATGCKGNIVASYRYIHIRVGDFNPMQFDNSFCTSLVSYSYFDLGNCHSSTYHSYVGHYLSCGHVHTRWRPAGGRSLVRIMETATGEQEEEWVR